MLITSKNYTKYIGKKMLFWTEAEEYNSNAYTGILSSYHSSYRFKFSVKYMTKELKEKKVDKCAYLNSSSANLFEFCSSIDIKDSKGNFLLDF